MRPGPRNLITDVTGLLVGNAQDTALRSGSTVLLAQQPMTAAVQVMGGAPGTCETDLLAPDRLVQKIDAITLSGGSVYGLAAAAGAVDGLRAMGRGFAVANLHVPIVPGAILFDLLNGGAAPRWKTPAPRLIWAPPGQATAPQPISSKAGLDRPRQFCPAVSLWARWWR
jgi:D-aminopeptidase